MKKHTYSASCNCIDCLYESLVRFELAISSASLWKRIAGEDIEFVDVPKEKPKEEEIPKLRKIKL